MSRRPRLDDDLVVTRTGLFYHRLGCRQIKMTVQPYEPGMTRTNPQTGQLVEVRPCKVCLAQRKTVETPSIEREWTTDDAAFERLMWSMLGAEA